jgi:aldehyde dehydrogenase (NAD+)
MKTGNGAVARIVMKAASNHLTPVGLELGGKCPVYVHSDVDAYTAARRIMWAKITNAGQTCIAPDYILVHRSKKDDLADALKKAFKSMLGSDPQKASEYPRIINARHFGRLAGILERQLDQTHSKILVGGAKDEKDLFLEPTVFVDVELSDPIMESELFGPLLGIITVEDENEAIEIINSRYRLLYRPRFFLSFSWTCFVDFVLCLGTTHFIFTLMATTPKSSTRLSKTLDPEVF